MGGNNTGSRDDGSRFLGKAAWAVLLVGLALVAPGFKDALLGWVNKQLGLGLSLDAPWWVGAIFVALGLMVLLPEWLHSFRRPHRSGDIFVAFQHRSFNAPPPQLPSDLLPKRLGTRQIRHVACDQSSAMTPGTLDLPGALREQRRAMDDLAAIRRTDPQAAIGYYGVVHIPFQLLAGCTLTTSVDVSLFELDRLKSTWVELKTGRGPDLKVATVTSVAEAPQSALIRVSVSYDVPLANAQEIVAGPFVDYHVSLATPTLDTVTHYEQVEAICREFRKALDDARSRLGDDATIHVFYAGPVSTGFSLGRSISRNVHGRVVVYNYVNQSKPKYAWGIVVNQEAEISRLVVRPTAIESSIPPILSE